MKRFFIFILFPISLKAQKINFDSQSKEWIIDIKFLEDKVYDRINQIRDSLHLQKLSDGNPKCRPIADQMCNYLAEGGIFSHDPPGMEFAKRSESLSGYAAETMLRYKKRWEPNPFYKKNPGLKSQLPESVWRWLYDDVTYDFLVNELVDIWLRSKPHKEILISGIYKNADLRIISSKIPGETWLNSVMVFSE